MGLAAILILSKTTNMFKRPAPDGVPGQAAEPEAADAHEREMEKLVLLVELERLKRAAPAPPEPGKEAQGGPAAP